jgi:uncharacterized membrane protein
LEEIARLADRQQWPLMTRIRAYQLVTVPASRAQWATFLDHNLLAGGSLSLLAGCIFFVAANWSLMGAYAKFLLLGALILASALYAQRSGLEKPASQWALTVSCGLVGALLALYGQVYQSGADPYTLFLGWALLILPWTLLLSFAPCWALWITVANTSLWLASESLPLLGLANLVYWALAQVFTPRLGWPQWPLTWTWMALTGSAWLSVMREEDGSGLLAWTLWVATAGAYAYRRRQRGTLSALGFSAIILVTTGIGRSLSDLPELGWLLVMGLAVIVQVTLLIHLVRRLPE